MRPIRLIAASIVAVLITAWVAPGTNAGARRPLSPGEVRERAGQLPPDLLHDVAAMQYVLTPAELADLLSDTDASRCRAWIEAWWFARDPIPTNKENEARAEHEQRVLAAQAHFGRGVWPGWDDRGAAVIRYGAPAVRNHEDADVQPPGIYIPAEETWYYPQFNVYARFSDTGKFGYVQYQESPQIPIGDRPRNDRRVMASKYNPDLPMDLMDVDAPATGALGLPRPMAEADYDNFMERVYSFYDLVDKMPAIYAFDYAAMHIPAFVSVQSFRGGDGVDRVDVNTEFQSTILPLVGTTPFRRFVTTSVFWDPRGEEIARYARADSIRTQSFAADSVATVLNQVTMTLPPGTYRMAVTVQEEGSGRFAAARREVFCHDMEDGMAMSDLSLARTIDAARDGSPFNRGPLEVVPRPSGRYRSGQSVPVYFEVYHVGIDELGARGYTVEYTVKPARERPRSLWGRLTRRREELMQVRSSFEAVASGPDDVVHVSAGTRNLSPGEYVLEVAVTDRATMRRVVREATFRLVK